MITLFESIPTTEGIAKSDLFCEMRIGSTAPSNHRSTFRVSVAEENAL